MRLTWTRSSLPSLAQHALLVVTVATVACLAVASGDAAADVLPRPTPDSPAGSGAAAPGTISPAASPAAPPAPAAKGCPDVEVPAAEPQDASGDGASLSERVKAALAAGDLVVALVLVLVGGFLTALSPCVYPLIPITLSILGARQASSHFKGFLLAATYVGGMVLLYSALGVGFAAAGFLAGSALQSPVITIGVALLCIVMAASMFGAFELALPSSLQTRLAQVGGGGFKGAFVMGLVAGIIAAPCTGPVLSFVLTLIARDGDVLKGGMLMVAYAVGMGLPFLVLGTFSQAIARMPKSGRWMEVVKSVFGLLMLGAGLYYLRLGIAPLAAAVDPLGRVGWLGPALVAAGVALGALHLSFKSGPPAERLRKGLGVTTSTAGIVALLAWGNAEPAANVGSGPEIAWTVVKDVPDAVSRFDQALSSAQQACRPVMVDFFAEWCTACKELDHKTYTDGRVRDEAQRFAAIKIDATNESEGLNALQARFGVVGLPTIVFIDGRGRVLKEPLVTGFVEPKDYVKLMQRVR